MQRLKSGLSMILASCILVIGSCGLHGAETGKQDSSLVTEVTAASLLSEVISHFPRDPLTISGEIIVRRRRGVPVRRMGFEMIARWGDSPSSVTYTIRDAFGSDLERLVVVRHGRRDPLFKYASGEELRPAARPALSELIQNTDMSWMDLTLGFLWWEGGKVTGEASVRGRSCYVVDVAAPQGSDQPYSRVVLWVDRKLRMLLQAEGYDKDNRVVRRLWVKSFKKINGRWMIKDMEIQTYPAVHRTRLHIREVGVIAPL